MTRGIKLTAEAARTMQARKIAALGAWPGDKLVRLRTLWDEGHSTAEIGRRMGVSKNSVVSKAHRLGLPARPSPVIRSADPAHVKRRDLVKPVRAVPLPGAAAPVQAVPDAPAVVRRSARPGCCTWPMWGDGARPTHVYCDAPAGGAPRWCEAHRARGTTTRQVQVAAQAKLAAAHA